MPLVLVGGIWAHFSRISPLTLPDHELDLPYGRHPYGPRCYGAHPYAPAAHGAAAGASLKAARAAAEEEGSQIDVPPKEDCGLIRSIASVLPTAKRARL